MQKERKALLFASQKPVVFVQKPKKIAGLSPAMTDFNQGKGIFKGTPLNGAGKG